MQRYVVSVTMDLNIEIDANSPEAAVASIVKAFALIGNPVDPLSETKINVGGVGAVIKTAIIQDWEIPEIDVQAA